MMHYAVWVERRGEIVWYRGGPWWWLPTRSNTRSCKRDWVFLLFWLRFIFSLEHKSRPAPEAVHGL